MAQQHLPELQFYVLQVCHLSKQTTRSCTNLIELNNSGLHSSTRAEGLIVHDESNAKTTEGEKKHGN